MTADHSTREERYAAVLREHDDPPGWTCLDDDAEALVYECNCGDKSSVLARGHISPEDVDAASEWHRAHVAAALVAADPAHAQPDAALSDETEPTDDQIAALVAASPNITGSLINRLQKVIRQCEHIIRTDQGVNEAGLAWVRTILRAAHQDDEDGGVVGRFLRGDIDSTIDPPPVTEDDSRPRRWGHWCYDQQPIELPAGEPRCPQCGAMRGAHARAAQPVPAPEVVRGVAAALEAAVMSLCNEATTSANEFGKRSFVLDVDEFRAAVTAALTGPTLDDHTHGGNHAPLGDDLLDPGYCGGCDKIRADRIVRDALPAQGES